jgi:hypothetical protein
MAKFTFVFDEATATALRVTAARLRKSQSLVVREAVADYAARAGRLTDGEQRRMLGVLDAMMRRPPSRAAGEVDAELREIRTARRKTGRRSAAE